MRKMKDWMLFPLIAVLALCCCFAACTSDPPEEERTPSVGTEEPEPQKPETYGVKVMSFNLDQAYGSDAAKNAKVYDRIVGELPDLLGVQEETPAWKSYLESALESEGYARVGEFRATSPSQPYYDYREASGIYYSTDRFRLKESGTFWLSDTPDVAGSVATTWSGEALFPRVCTWAVLTDKRSGEDLAYFNTHFSYEAEILRTKSAELIVSKIGETNVRAFFSGDLNFPSDTEPATYATLTAELEDSRTSAAVTTTGCTFHNYGQSEGEIITGSTDKIASVPIDYIFFTKDDFTALSFDILRESGERAEDFASDHYAVVAEFSYEKQAAV